MRGADSESVEAFDDETMRNFIEEEDEVEETGVGRGYLETVDDQNDCLMDNKLKEFLHLCKTKKAKVDFNLSKEFLLKDGTSKGTLPKEIADVVSMDAEELKNLVSTLKNSIMGMRIKVAKIIDLVNECNSNPQDSISLINLRMEVLCEYWSYLSLFVIKKLNGETVGDHPIIKRLLFLRQFLLRLKPVFKKLDFQISRYLSLAGKDLAEVGWNQQEDALLMRPNLAFEDLGDDINGEVEEDEFDEATRAAISRKVDRALENSYQTGGKQDKQTLIRAIRDKREKMTKENRKEARLDQFKKKRLLESKLVRDLEDELDERPIESEKRPNIAGIYDPMQEERQKTDEKNFTHTVLTKKEKKVINKRVNRLKQQQKIDDFSEIKQFGEMMSKMGGTTEAEGKKLSKHDQYKQKKRGGWQLNTDEEKYDSKRQAKLKRSGKFKVKKARK